MIMTTMTRTMKSMTVTMSNHTDNKQEKMVMLNIDDDDDNNS